MILFDYVDQIIMILLEVFGPNDGDPPDTDW